MARARTPHSSSRPSMLTALRIDARATDIHSSAMTIHTYASPSAKPREGDDGGDDSGARRQCAKFTIWNDFGDKENVDPVTATAATTRRRSKDCTPSRPPLADITRRFTPPNNKLTPGRYTLKHGAKGMGIQKVRERRRHRRAKRAREADIVSKDTNRRFA